MPKKKPIRKTRVVIIPKKKKPIKKKKPVPKKAYSIKKIIRYRERSTGRYTTKRRGTLKEEVYEQTMPDGGKRVIDIYSVKTRKTSVSADIINQTDGHIGRALGRSGIMSLKETKGAKRIDFTIRGKDSKGNDVEIKKTVQVEGESRIHDLMIGRLVGAIHDAGYRPQYKLESINWKNRTRKKTHSKQKKILNNLEIIVSIKK